MEKIILDADRKAKLKNLNSTIDVCDEAGRTVGHFVPADWYMKLVYAYEKAEFAKEEKEIQAREEKGGYTTPEAIAYLQKLRRTDQQ